MRVHVVCQDLDADRVVPRFARYLRDRLGWTASSGPAAADVLYFFPYFEAQRIATDSVQTAAYFTHREEDGSKKAQLFDEIASRVDLRLAMCRLYGDGLRDHGPTAQPPLPVETDRFTIAPRVAHRQPVVGLSGYTYGNGRKGEDLVGQILGSKVAGRVTWKASGRGWRVPTRRYVWADMPEFYRSLDVLVCPSLVEGGPMPVLEALACGVSVVIPKGVGVLDELPDAEGIHRYDRGDAHGLVAALERAAFPDHAPEPEALRAAVARHSVEAFVEAHRVAFERVFGVKPAATPAPVPPVERSTGKRRGIYCVAFGAPAREAAVRMMRSAKAHMPDVPICLCAASPIGPEDLFVEGPDTDVGGRRAKIRVYEQSPAEWETVLYLDADTEVVAPIYQYFQWAEDGWELVITHDIKTMETLHSLGRKVSPAELRDTLGVVGTEHTLQLAGGAFAFRRSDRVARFFARWEAEWAKYGARDQAPLLRALHAEPLRTWVLGNEWNTFPKYQPHQKTAGLLHWPGDARRWEGQIEGRIDSAEAWRMVERHERRVSPARRRG